MTAKEKYYKILDRFLPPIVIEALYIAWGITVDSIWVIVIGLVLEVVILWYFFKQTRSLKDDGDHSADQ